LSIYLGDEEAYDAAAKVWPEMLEADWYREQARDGGTTDSLGVFIGKESLSDDHWLGDVWWEVRQNGLDVRVTDDYRNGLSVRLGPKDYSSPLKAETHKYGKRRKVKPREFLIRSVQAFLRGIQDGSNGKDRTFTAKLRGPVKAGTPAQNRSVKRLEDLARQSGRSFENKGGDREVRIAIMPEPGVRGSYQDLLFVYVSVRGKIDLKIIGRGPERTYRNQRAWEYLERTLGGRDESLQEADARVRELERTWKRDAPPEAAMALHREIRRTRRGSFEFWEKELQRNPRNQTVRALWLNAGQREDKPTYSVNQYRETWTWPDEEDAEAEREVDEVRDDEEMSLGDLLGIMDIFDAHRGDNPKAWSSAWWEYEPTQNHQTGADERDRPTLQAALPHGDGPPPLRQPQGGPGARPTP
jgi:hypothetical protein